MLITQSQFQQFAPAAKFATVAALFADDALSKALVEFDIGTPARVAAFLAQTAHETGGFRYLIEIWGPTAQQKKYDPPSKLAAQLGNIKAGDGKQYRGRGLIQITGRANYKSYGQRLKLPLETQPELAAQPGIAARIAGSYWQHHGLNALADKATVEAFYKITRRINGGSNGITDRLAWWAKAKKIWQDDMS